MKPDAEQRLSSILAALPHERVVRVADLATTVGLSARTVHRHLAECRRRGLRIEGEPGLGIMLRRRKE